MSLARAARPLAALAVLGMGVHAVLVLAWAPAPAGFAAPLTQRMLYYHVPAAFAAYAAFGLAVVGSARHLRTRDLRHDALAHASAEVAALFATLALLTGIVWSRVEFFSAGSGGTFAFALLGDPKFVTTAALALVLLGYLALRRSLDEPGQRARLSAAYALLGFVSVPLSYLSSRYSPHPDFLAPGAGIAPSMALVLGASVALWMLLLAALLAHRLLAERAEAAPPVGRAAPGPAEGSA